MAMEEYGEELEEANQTKNLQFLKALSPSESFKNLLSDPNINQLNSASQFKTPVQFKR